MDIIVGSVGMDKLTDKEVDRIVKDMKETTKKITLSKAASLEFLMKAGICDKDGELTKEYEG